MPAALFCRSRHGVSERETVTRYTSNVPGALCAPNLRQAGEKGRSRSSVGIRPALRESSVFPVTAAVTGTVLSHIVPLCCTITSSN